MTQDPIEGSATLVELLRARAAAEPDEPAYTFLEDGERETDELTFGELDRRARAIGALLQERTGAAKSGARALLLYPAGLDFVAAFFGAMYGGAIAVPAPVGEAAQMQRTLPRLQAVARDARPAVILTTAAGKKALEDLFRLAPEMAEIPILATDALPAGAEDAWEDPRSTGDDLSFLQYTSGSTSAPKGVMVSHANVLYTAQDIDAGWRYDADSVLVTWLPIFHDMGLICGIVLPAYKGFHAYVMSPTAFIQKPLRWLAAMSRYQATHSAAPNFAYDLCVRKIGPKERAELDLSRWDVTLNSAEPVRRETMERFADAFGPCGFRMEVFCPGFGLAEATVKVTASPRGALPAFLNLRNADLEHHRLVLVPDDERGPGVVSLVGNGPPILATEVVIANPETRERLGTMQLGEIWVAGPCVAQGYWQRPDESEHTFGARLAGEEGAGPYMRTGDLGFVDEAGEVYCAGRIKDLVIVRGRNFYPQDVELCAEQAHPAVRPGCAAAFAADVEGEERLVVCIELDPRKLGASEDEARARIPDVLGAVKQAIAEEFELLPYAVVATGPRAVPKTSSGKIQRRACRELFLSLGLDAVGIVLQRADAPAKPAASVVRARILAADEAQRQRMIEFYLLSLLAPALANADPARPELDVPLVHLGLDLPRALDWIDTLRETLGAEVPPLAFFSRLTMQELAALVLHELARPVAAGPDDAPAERAVTEALSGPPSARDVEDWLVDKIASQTGADPRDVEVHRPFSFLGLDSMLAVDLAMDLEDWLGRPLPSTLVWDYPTIEAVARYLAGEGERAPAAEPAPASPAAREGTEPIAIVGMACRFPGAADLDAFWELLVDKVDAIRETPEARWSQDLYDPKPGRPGKMATRWGGFLDDVELFDAGFFGISAREAARLDPQQRIVLETTVEALEHAGISTDRLAGSATGLYLGKSSHDYLHFQLAELEDIDGYASTGNAASVAAGRVNYVLDWHGPSMAIDTACSSSLVAIHQARRGLLAGECDVAVAGGVNLTLIPHWTISFSHAHMMSSDGRCKTFDSRANGYVRGEGCGMIVMKRLSDALRDRDDVICVIRGSAVNHDGASNGITAPSGHAQQDVIRRALRDGGVRPAQVGYVEAHGTGTPLGDPIEMQALAEVLGEGRAPEDRCLVGSVKTNIGHLEPAAGAAGLIKAALALWKREIPPQIHFQEINPRIAIDTMPLAIANERKPWEGADERFAGCSSFGFAGTNAHVVLGGAPDREAPAGSDRPLHVAALSARSPEALAALAGRLAAHLDAPASRDERLADVCFTLLTGRAHHAHRVALPVATREDLRVACAAIAAGETPRGAVRGAVADRRPSRVAFLVPDALGVALEAGHALAQGLHAYRASLETALAAGPGADALAHLLALGDALARAGVRPVRALGHGVGAHAAAALLGEIPREEALRRALASEGPHADADADRAALEACDVDAFVLLGEDPAWSAALDALPDAVRAQAGGPEGWTALLGALARLHVAGFALDWEGFERDHPRRRVHLPTYPFERRAYWFKSKRRG
jgi:acyl-CoA synthetase (AMP-forming)/AMP-acid ligase II/3-oxoacyl-(acyl-carrier-protein) synthase/acyl carrier protein